MTRRRPIRAVVLLSGGLDSTTCLAAAVAAGREVHGLSVDYGQRHRGELRRARALARLLGAASHRVVKVDLSAFGGSALTDAAIAVPKGRSPRAMGHDIPVTYVPARNTVMLSLALAHAEVIGAEEIHVGVNAVDYSGYPDCRPEFIEAMEEAVRLGTKVGVEGHPIRIETPLIDMTKADIIRHGLGLGVPYEMTWSCYEGGAEPCHECDSCRLREAAWESLHMGDPLNVREP